MSIDKEGVVVLEPISPQMTDEDDDDDFGSFDDASIDDESPSSVISNIFNDGDETKISNYIGKVLDTILPTADYNDTTSMEDSQFGLLNERSTEILNRLTQPPTYKRIMNENTWKRSTIRREMLLNLGLPINLDEINDVKRSKFNDGCLEWKVKNESELNLPEFANLNMSDAEMDELLKSTTPYLDGLNIQKAEYYKSISSEEKLVAAQRQLDLNLTHLKKMYVSWKEYESNLKKDNNIFQDYIENMVGNELKFRNEKMLQAKLKLKKK